MPSRSQFELSASGLQLTVIADLPARLLLSSKAFLSELYLEKGLSAAQIAKKIVSSRSTIQDALNRHGIPARNGVDSNHSQKFGRKRVKGDSVPHNGEQRIIATIQKLAAQGLSLPKICEILNAMRVPTKRRGKKWLPEMGRRILGAKEIKHAA